MLTTTSFAGLSVLVAPDSFKGSLSALGAAESMARGVARALPGARITRMPIADGGEGTAEAIQAACGGDWDTVPVVDANGNAINAPFVSCETSKFGPCAVLDVASIAGLPNAKAPPEDRTTRGVGQAIRGLRQKGFSTIVIGLGGSSTMDAGAGMLAEIAVNTFSHDRLLRHPTYRTLPEVTRVARRDDAGWLHELRLIALSDVSSPLNGPQGASAIFGQQKGFVDLQKADQRLHDFATLCEATLGRSVRDEPGAGAAGGLGFALKLIGADIMPGADFILDTAMLDETMQQYDWVLTGEGQSDAQTLLGKAPALLAKRARKHQVPVSLLSGAIDSSPLLEEAFDGCFSIMDRPQSLRYAMDNAHALLEAGAFHAAKLFGAARRK